jgi:thiol-disulfide isomerase/thioredoxin
MAVRRLIIGAVVASALVSIAPWADASAQDLGIRVGQKAPAALVETLDGRSVDLAQYVGKTPLLIEFWATWCPNCAQLEPVLLRSLAAHQGKIRFLGIAVSVNQTPQRVKLYAERHKLPGEILYDRKGFAADAYEVPATSYVVAIDGTGTVVYTGLGGDQDIDAAITKAIGAK